MASDNHSEGKSQVSVGLRVLEYNLTLVPVARPGSGSLNFASSDVEPALSSAFVTDDGNRIVSPADQISIVISPPTLGVVDHSGAQPVRPQIRRPVETIVQILEVQGFDVAAFGWNLVGRVHGLTPSDAMRSLIDEQGIDSAISHRGDLGWFVPLVQLRSESEMADQISLGLQILESEETSELGFAVNAHFERQLALDDLLQSGENVWVEIEGLVTRLVQ